jgi:hypothetical protein
MSTGYQINDQEGMYYLTFQVVDWIDVFTRQVYRDVFIESLKIMCTQVQDIMQDWIVFWMLLILDCLGRLCKW